MPRKESNPRVRAIVAALDRAAASPYADEDALVPLVASVIVDRGDTMFTLQGWSAAHARAIAISFALHAPTSFLREMAEAAERQRAFVEEWDRGGHSRARGLSASSTEEAAYGVS